MAMTRAMITKRRNCLASYIRRLWERGVGDCGKGCFAGKVMIADWGHQLSGIGYLLFTFDHFIFQFFSVFEISRMVSMYRYTVLRVMPSSDAS